MKYILLGINGVLFLYLLGAFLVPVLMKYGNEDIASRVYEMYHIYCHQRVERSLFLFGSESFYSIQDLKDAKYIINVSDSEWPEYYGDEYVGNEQLGYKVAICLRDIVLISTYLFLQLFFGVYRWLSKREIYYSRSLILLLIIPFILDISLGLIVDIFNIFSMQWYIDDLIHRVITSVLLAVAINIVIFGSLKS